VSGGLPYEQIVSGNDLSCGRTSAGDVWCWGYDVHGSRLSPVQLPLPALTSISVTATGSCGLSATGQGYCWGSDFFGQAGDGPSSSFAWVDPSASAVVQGGHAFIAITTGLNHACGLDGAGKAWCWGDNSDLQLGNSSSAFRNPTPLSVSGNHVFAQIFGGWNHTCALEPDGTAWCWGKGNVGQLGNANRVSSTAPQRVDGFLQFATLTLGNSYTCGRTTTGQVYCWGLNNFGQLGLGNPAAWDTPQLVH
jgi:alpha-tubulin suppressor-like RCC1 family protein